MPELTRRQFSKLALAGAAATTFSAVSSMGDRKARALVPRAHGPVLTDGYSEWEQSCRNTAHNLNKVVTGWGGPWRESPDRVWTACTISDFTIVRTVTGDTRNGLDAAAAVAEIRDTRFFDLKRDAKGADKLIIEIGNEPNAGGQDVNAYASALGTTIDQLRANFPGARLCSTALSPNKGTNPMAWYDNRNWRNQVARCDFVGIHFYTNDPQGDFTKAGNYNELTLWETLSIVDARWNIPAIATEYSIRGYSLSQYDKGYRYADLIHFNQSLPGTDKLWGATYFHIMVNPQGPNPDENMGTEGPRGYGAKLHG
jgi:hypothetical protein